jgi:hypothetical protein
VSPLVSSGRIVDLLFTAGVTVISLVAVIYSLLFLVVEWVSGAFSMRLALFRNDPIVWRAFAYAIGLFVFCFTAAFAIGNDQKVSVILHRHTAHRHHRPVRRPHRRHRQRDADGDVPPVALGARLGLAEPGHHIRRLWHTRPE